MSCAAQYVTKDEGILYIGGHLVVMQIKAKKGRHSLCSCRKNFRRVKTTYMPKETFCTEESIFAIFFGLSKPTNLQVSN